jgi:hypothetical protein
MPLVRPEVMGTDAHRYPLEGPVVVQGRLVEVAVALPLCILSLVFVFLSISVRRKQMQDQKRGRAQELKNYWRQRRRCGEEKTSIHTELLILWVNRSGTLKSLLMIHTKDNVQRAISSATCHSSLRSPDCHVTPIFTRINFFST